MRLLCAGALSLWVSAACSDEPALCGGAAACAPGASCVNDRCVDFADAGPLFDGGTCAARTASVAEAGADHVPGGTPIDYASNPPAGGAHYPEWLRWARRYDVVDRGYYVHNQEHGGVILMSPCAEGCDLLGQELERIGRSLQKDPSCDPLINARWIVVRDPLLPPGTGVAAATWGWTFTAPCLDEAKLRAFIDAHYDRAPESSCDEGQRP